MRSYHNAGSRLASEFPAQSEGISNCENSGNRTCIPPILFSVLCMECVITALTSWSISACGVCTKYDTLPLGADCRHSWLSVATGLYMNTIALDSLPSYKTYTTTIIAICLTEIAIFS